mgnify:CR=1 FL=1
MTSPHLDLITKDDVTAAANTADIDAAILKLQEKAGITDGGQAGESFSGFDWSTEPSESRFAQICAWLTHERALAGLAGRQVVPGSRVRLVQDVDNYPTCYIKAGETGTLTRIDSEGAYWIKLDAQHPELAEWENELQIWDYSDQDHAYHPSHSVETI